MSRLVMIITRVWLYLIAFLILVGFLGALMHEGFWAAITSPFNDWKFLALIVSLLPGFGLLELGKWLDRRGKQSEF